MDATWQLADAAVLRSVRASARVIAAVNIAGFVLTAATRTHKITDLCGTLAFVVSAWTTRPREGAGTGAGAGAGSPVLKTLRGPTALALLVTAWGVRLGGFLFARVNRVGHDARLTPFFEDGAYPAKLAGFWFLQAMWAFLSMLPVTVVHGVGAAAVDAAQRGKGDAAKDLVAALRLRAWNGAALALCAAAFATETVADYQKDSFKSLPGNAERFYDSGLFGIVRYPNYAAEIAVWAAIWAAMGPALMRRYKVAALSPLMVAVLLTRVSGIPLLERAHRRKYGADAAWQAYVAGTPALIPGVW